MKQLGPIVAALLAGAALIWVVATTMPEDNAPPQGTDEPASEGAADDLPNGPTQGQAPPGAPPPSNAPAAAADRAQPTTPEPYDSNRERPLPPPQRSAATLLDPRIAQFEREPRDSDAPEFEKHIESFFESDEVPPGVLDSVLCRQTICRVRMRWTTERATGVLSASMRMFMGPEGTWPSERLQPDPALDVDPNADPNGVVMIDMYVRRKTAEEAEQARKDAAAARAQIEQMKAQAAERAAQPSAP